MDLNKILNKYLNQGNFTFIIGEDYKSKCNAPKDRAGVYLIYKLIENRKELIYIGSSGQRDKAGRLKIRKGGIYDRLINGYHPNKFGQEKRIKRKIAFPMQMIESKIEEIKISWYVTFDEENFDFPTDIEKILYQNYKTEFNLFWV
jgi:hypothetical protein